METTTQEKTYIKKDENTGKINAWIYPKNEAVFIGAFKTKALAKEARKKANKKAHIDSIILDQKKRLKKACVQPFKNKKKIKVYELRIAQLQDNSFTHEEKLFFERKN